MTQIQESSSSGAGAVVATVGCSVLGMMLAGPVGAVIGGTLAIAATAGSAHRAAQQRMSLNISSISMPEVGMTRQEGVTYFAVDVVDTQGATWRILRRYNHFDRFRKRLQRCGVRKPFPGKLWFGCEGARLRERRRGLENWTREVVRIYSSSGVPGRLQSEFNDFFTRGRGQVTTQDSYPPGSFPIEVPAGVGPGQQLTVKNPADGSSFNITVPEGMGPGSILQVQPPPQASQPSAPGAVPDAAVCPTPKGSFREADAVEPQKTLLNISVPAGVLPGQTIAVKVPDGRELHVVVPQGAGQESDGCTLWKLISKVREHRDELTELPMEQSANSKVGHLTVSEGQGCDARQVIGRLSTSETQMLLSVLDYRRNSHAQPLAAAA